MDVKDGLITILHAKLNVFGALTHIDSGLSLNAQLFRAA